MYIQHTIYYNIETFGILINYCWLKLESTPKLFLCFHIKLLTMTANEVNLQVFNAVAVQISVIYRLIIDQLTVTIDL